MVLFPVPLDDTGKVAVRLQKCTIGALAVYIVDIVLSFILSLVYKSSYVNLIFAFMGFALTIGFIAARRRDLKLTGAYLVIMSVMLSLVLLGGVFTLISSIALWNNYKVSQIEYPIGYTPPSVAFPQFCMTIAVLLLHPILFLLDIYLLSLGSRLRGFLMIEKSSMKQIELERQVWQQVEAIAKLMATEKPHFIPGSLSTRRNSKAKIEREKSKHKIVIEGKEHRIHHTTSTSSHHPRDDVRCKNDESITTSSGSDLGSDTSGSDKTKEGNSLRPGGAGQ